MAELEGFVLMLPSWLIWLAGFLVLLGIGIAVLPVYANARLESAKEESSLLQELFEANFEAKRVHPVWNLLSCYDSLLMVTGFIIVLLGILIFAGLLWQGFLQESAVPVY